MYRILHAQPRLQRLGASDTAAWQISSIEAVTDNVLIAPHTTQMSSAEPQRRNQDVLGTHSPGVLMKKMALLFSGLAAGAHCPLLLGLPLPMKLAPQCGSK